MTHLLVKKKNEVYVTVHSPEEYVHRELADYFTFEVPEAKYLKKNPRYRHWDGTIQLYSPATGALYHGLTEHLHTWAHEKQTATIDKNKVVEHEFLYNFPPVASPDNFSNAGLCSKYFLCIF